MSESALYLSDPEAANRLRRRRMAEELMRGGAGQPIRAHSQGLAQMANALVGGIELGQLDAEDRASRADADRRMEEFRARFTGQPASEPAPAPAPVQVASLAAPPLPQPGALAGALIGGGSPREANAAAAAQRAALLDNPNLSPEQVQAGLAEISANRAGAAGVPEIPGGYRANPGVDGAFAGLPPPTGQVARPPAQPAAAPQPGGFTPQQIAALQSALTDRDPRIRAAAEAQYKLLQLVQREPPRPVSLSPGGALVDPQTGRVIAERPQSEPRPVAVAPGSALVDPQTGRVIMQRPPSDAGPAPGTFGGTGMDAQANNALLRIGPKIANGTASDEERRQYSLAYGHLTAPTLQQVPVDPGDPSKGLALAQVPRSAPQGFPAPDFQPPQPKASTSPAASQQAAPAGAPTPIPGTQRVSVPSVPAGYERAPDGSLRPMPGGPADPRSKELTETQARSNMFGQAMTAADETLRGLRVPRNATLIAWRNLPEGAVNLALSENDQKYFNALRGFAAGILRKETGASFGAAELLDVQSRFFPMPGDSPSVIQQKAEARQRAIESMRAEIPGGFRGGASGAPAAAEPPPPPAGFRIVR